MARLLLATANPGKVAEYRRLLGKSGWELLTPQDLGLELAEETGTNYEENAKIKALSAARQSGLVALADDSGLEVDALGGGPGHLSARFADATDEGRVAALLERLKGVPWAERTARFRCVIAIAQPDGKVTVCEGVMEGGIAEEPRGRGGFGYDPVFYLPEHGKTVAELSADEKNAVSHRGRAARQALTVLEGMRHEQR